MKRALMVAAVVLLVACQAAADGPHGEGEREGHPAKRAADAFVRQVESEGEPWLRPDRDKPRRWVFEGPGGECRMIELYTFRFRLDRHVGDSSKGERVPLSSMNLDLEGEPCPAGYRLPWRRGGASR